MAVKAGAKAKGKAEGFRNAFGRNDGPIPRNRVHASAKWQRSYGMYIVGQAMVDEVTLLAEGIERQWGSGRLRLIVGPELRAKFDRQRFLYSQAIHTGELEDVRTQSERMQKAWKALDRAAREAGMVPQPVTVWDVVSPDGHLYAIARTADDAKAWRGQQDDPRGGQVWTLDEVACLLDAQSLVRTVKEAFSEAEVVRVQKSVGDALEDVTDDLRGVDDDGGMLDDVVPF